jgi:hypothetical protein
MSGMDPRSSLVKSIDARSRISASRAELGDRQEHLGGGFELGMGVVASGPGPVNETESGLGSSIDAMSRTAGGRVDRGIVKNQPPVLDYCLEQPIQVRIIQEKLNGYNVEIHKSAGGVVAVLRGGRDIWGLLKINPAMADPILSLPDETTLYCELHCPGMKSAAVITLLNSGDPRLQLTPFAAGMYAGRQIEFNQFMDAMQRHGITPARCVRYSERPFSVDTEALLKQAAADGIEGYVLKQSHLDGWYRLKPEKTIDAFVIDYELSHSKSFKGGLKSFVVGVHEGLLGIRILANVSLGFEHEFKRTCDPKAYLGKVIEVSYSDVLEKGRLQFPRFIRWRMDKTESGCTLTKGFEHGS